MNIETKSDLIRFNASLLTSCPISTCIEDWHKYLPKRCSKKFYRYLMIELEKLDNWHKNKARELTDIIRKDNKND